VRALNQRHREGAPVRKADLAAVCCLLALAGCSGPPQVKGEVADVDLARKMVTLNHEAIPNVSMPAMTMTFAVNDAAVLGKFKAGDHVRFTADWVDGTLTITSIKPDQAAP
jgi:Cu(I)/Ag(I) efflux system protein CusF